MASDSVTLSRDVLSMKAVHVISFILLVVGGLNWGLVGVNNYNLVDSVLGAGSTAAMVVYVLVGLSAIFEIVTHKKNCKDCSSGGAAA